MLHFLGRALQEAARNARQLAGLGLVFLTVRLAWLAAADGLSAAGASARRGAGQGEELSEPQAGDPAAAIRRGHGRHRPDIEILNDLVGPAASGEVSIEEKPDVTVRVRRMLVDVGPERSEVFIQGRKVGQTPYAGQIQCVHGELIKIDILPPEGAPLQRKISCTGSTLLAND